MSKLPALSAKCSYPQCCCHKGSDTNSSLKSCSACGIAAYCCKQAQKKDWCRHKKTCMIFRRFKHDALYFTIQQKATLDSISLDLPPIVVEYEKKYGTEIDAMKHCFMIKSALVGMTRDMVSITNLIKVNIPDAFLRWNEMSFQVLEFMSTAKHGDIYVDTKYFSYDPGAPQQFRNTPLPMPAVLKNGTTVVDIGFVDFGIAYDSIDLIEFQGSPVTVFGYDMEPFCVAKSMIMMEMIKDVSVSTRSVIEVWLSSLWSEATYRAFKKATKHVLLKGEHNGELDETVKRIIQFWSQREKMAVTTALQFQLQAISQQGLSTYLLHCCSLASEVDRVRILRYFLTKALYEDESTTIGSVVMNFVNEDIGVKQMFANCFETSPARIHMSIDPSFPKNSTVVDRTISYFEDNMEKFIRHVRNGTLIFIPKVGVAELSNHQMIQEIRRKRPHIISWSNVIDYIAPGDFHKLARRMSCDDTTHYFHSINWNTRVFGSDVTDFNEKDRLSIYSAGLNRIEATHAVMEGFTNQGMYDFRDVCAIFLGTDFCDYFLRYFFADQDVNCSSSSGLFQPLALPWPLARKVSTLFLMFAYTETGITFGDNTYDYFSG